MVKPDSETFFFAHARTALWYGLQQLPMEDGQAMLVPDYICEVVLHPLEDLGIRTVFYPVDENFVPNWEVLKSLQRSESVNAFLIVHYFGQPSEIEHAIKFCEQNGLWLIEDNAHGHGGNFNGQPLGSFGDMGFSSPRKQLQSDSGALLYMNGKPVFHTTEELSSYSVSNMKKILRYLIRPFPRINAGLHRMLRSEPDYSDPFSFPEIRVEYQRADPNSVRCILAMNWSEHATLRREAWKAWSHFSLNNGLLPVWQEPHPESCPWLMPVYSSSTEDRLHWISWGRKKGLDILPWPTLPEQVLKSSPHALRRWKHLLCFPLNQNPEDF